MRFLVIIVLMLGAPISYAMTVEGYISLSADAQSEEQKGKISNLSLDMYLYGITDAVDSERKWHKGVLYINETAIVCIPENVELSNTLLRAAIDYEIGKNKANYEQSLGAKWQQTNVAQVAKIGLARMFPC